MVSVVCTIPSGERAPILNSMDVGIRDDLKKVKDLIPSQEPGVEGDATSQTGPPIAVLSMLTENLNSTVKPAASSSSINVLLKVASTMITTMIH